MDTIKTPSINLARKSNYASKKEIPKKLIVVMIPAYNESQTIRRVIEEIPRSINNHNVKILVIDDGSTDNTVQIAKSAGADYILRNKRNLGLAHTFQKGMNFALNPLGADIIVNTDADFQYNQKEITQLTLPIIHHEADIVSGNRQVETLNHMSKAKKYGNILGTKFVSKMAGYKIKDASSGFRAYSREAALRLFVTSAHTYTHQTLIQASQRDLKVVEIPVEFRKRENGNSKLISSVSTHIKKSTATIARTTLMYNPLKVLGYIGIFLVILGLIPLIRWFYLGYIIHSAGDHIQSLLLGMLLIIFGGMSILLGFIADLIATNRKYLEEILYKLRKMELKESNKEI